MKNHWTLDELYLKRRSDDVSGITYISSRPNLQNVKSTNLGIFWATWEKRSMVDLNWMEENLRRLAENENRFLLIDKQQPIDKQ